MSDINKELQKLETEIKAAQSHSSVSSTTGSNARGSAGNELLEFFMGFLLLGGGIYWVLNSFEVRSSWGWGYYSFFGMKVTGGVMLIPLLVGIGLCFFLDGKKRAIGGAIAALGLLIVLISLLSSLSFHPRYGSLYVYVLMFGMIAAGSGLLIKTLFKKRD